MDTSLYDQVLNTTLTASQPDRGNTAKRISDLLASVVQRFPGCAMAAVPSEAVFLVPDGQGAGPNQATESGFLHSVAVDFCAGFGTPEQETVSICEATIRSFFGYTKVLGSIEQIVREMCELGTEPMPAAVAEASLVRQLLALPTVWNDIFQSPLPDVPWYDDTQEDDPLSPEDIAEATKAGSLQGITDILSNIVGGGPWPKYGGPSSGPLGNRVHVYLQRSYVDNWRDHIVAVEGKYWLQPVTYEPRDLDNPDTALDEPQKTRAQALRKTIWISLPAKPDIADLSDSRVGEQAGVLSDWGWFEIKNARAVRNAIDKLGKYILKYDKQLILLKGFSDPQGFAFPGLWNPPQMLAVDVAGARILVIARVLPGIILYYPFELKAMTEAAAVVLIGALAAGLVGKLQRKSARFTPKGWPELSPEMQLIVALALVILILVLLPEEVIVGAAAAIAYLAELMVGWLGTLLEAVPALVAVPG